MTQRLTSSTSSIPARLKLLGFANYREYLDSEHWQEFRKKFFSKSAVCKNLRSKFGELRCQFCHKSAVLHLHHRTYKRLGAEHLSDVVLICADCHQKSHERHKLNPRNGLWSATNQVGRKKRKIRQAKARRLRLGVYARRKARRRTLREAAHEN